MRKTVPYYDEAMTQYIMDAASSVDEVVIKHLSMEDRYILNNISTASLEQKLHLLGKLGKRFAIVIADRGKVISRPLNMKPITTWFRRRILKLVGPTLKSWGLFVRADKELMQNLSRLSMDINPKTMFLLRNYEELAAHAENVKSIHVKASIEQQSQLIIDKMIQECYGLLLRYGPFDRKRYKLAQDQLPILFYFSYNRDRYITALEISMFTAVTVFRVTKLLNGLIETGHIQEDIQEGLIKEDKFTKVYQLTGYGVSIVNLLRERITSHT